MTTDWWEDFFDLDFAEAFLATREDLDDTAEFLIDVLSVGSDSRVFDQCCGVGDLAFALARRGVEVIGVDQSERYIERARQRADELSLPCRFHVGDAFEYEPATPCDAAVNWYTSFGYVEDDTRNGAMLTHVFASLRPGRRFALDYLSTPAILANFEKRQTWCFPRPEGDLVLERVTSRDFTARMFRQRWIWRHPNGQRRERHGATRMYLPHQLGALLENAGFVDIEIYGGIDGSPFSDSSRRTICVGRKPDRTS